MPIFHSSRRYKNDTKYTIYTQHVIICYNIIYLPFLYVYIFFLKRIGKLKERRGNKRRRKPFGGKTNFVSWRSPVVDWRTKTIMHRNASPCAPHRFVNFLTSRVLMCRSRSRGKGRCENKTDKIRTFGRRSPSPRIYCLATHNMRIYSMASFQTDCTYIK